MLKNDDKNNFNLNECLLLKKVVEYRKLMTPGYKFDVQTSVFILFLQGHPLYISLSAFENRLWEYIRNLKKKLVF